jgi:hypothetical protein
MNKKLFVVMLISVLTLVLMGFVSCDNGNGNENEIVDTRVVAAEFRGEYRSESYQVLSSDGRGTGGGFILTEDFLQRFSDVFNTVTQTTTRTNLPDTSGTVYTEVENSVTYLTLKDNPTKLSWPRIGYFEENKFRKPGGQGYNSSLLQGSTQAGQDYFYNKQ